MTSKRDQPMHHDRGDDEAQPLADGGADVWGPVDDVADGDDPTLTLPETTESGGATTGYDRDLDDDAAYFTAAQYDADEAADAGEPQGSEPATTDRMAKSALRMVLAAILIGGIAAGGVLFATGGFDDLGEVGSSVIGDNVAEQNDFTRSEVGDCLTWTADAPGDPVAVDCVNAHRFEVSGVLDTASFPTQEFASTAPWPGVERFAEIRDENCAVLASRYLGGGLDPQGRFAPGLMFPSQAEWERGVRSLRCGIEQPGVGGVQELFKGRVRDNDQSFTWPEGTCIGIDVATRKPTGTVVNCAEPHAFQVTGSVDLSQRFGGRNSGKPWPSVNDQNEYLRGICPTHTNRFFGGAEKFKATTLNVQWSVLSEVSWLTGSRRVFCYAALPNRGGFATLVGDARDDALLINGKVPTPPDEGPPGRSVGDPVPLPPGYTPDDAELPVPGGG